MYEVPSSVPSTPLKGSQQVSYAQPILCWYINQFLMLSGDHLIHVFMCLRLSALILSWPTSDRARKVKQPTGICINWHKWICVNIKISTKICESL